MMMEHKLPADIERTSFQIISQKLEQTGILLPKEEEAVIKRVIHTTADFEYAKSMRLTDHAVELGARALLRGIPIVTDTTMAMAGVSKPGLSKCGAQVHCFISDPEVVRLAKENGTTRAVAAVHKAARLYPRAVFAVGNAPTALFTLCDEMERDPGFRPSLIIGVPVGFVNVVESKQRLVSEAEKYGVPVIAAMGRKGGSNVAAAICNAIIYTATGMLEPSERGWQG